MEFLQEFERILSELSAHVREGREISYRDEAYGITEIISCPKKAQLRRQHPDLEVRNIAIDDGFLFEKTVKEVLRKIFGNRFEEEKVLSHDFTVDGEPFSIDGHLDCFIQYNSNKIVGLELKHTVLSFDNETSGRPEELIILQPNSRRISINYKYILQAKIQKALLEWQYPDKEIEHYLVIKTTLRTRYKMGKSIVVLPTIESISREELEEIIRMFRNDPRPRANWECQYCIYRQHGLCNGSESANTTLEHENAELIMELLDRYSKIQTEAQMIQEQLKQLINGTIEYKGKEIGWTYQERTSWDIKAFVKLLKAKGYNPLDYLQVNGRKARLLENELGEELDKVREKTARPVFKLWV